MVSKYSNVKFPRREQLLDFLSTIKSTDCLIWPYPLDHHGYGYVSVPKSEVARGSMYVSRVAWQFANGPIPDGMFVCHSCDTPACFNPIHFFLGTPADNMADKTKKGRQMHGATHYAAKLSDADVLKIRELYRTGKYSQTELARTYGIYQTAICKIVHRNKWKHLP